MATFNKNMTQLPESLNSLKDYCSRCGRMLGKGSKYVKASVEQISAEGETLSVDYDQRCFCEECVKGGVYISVKDPERDAL